VGANRPKYFYSSLISWRKFGKIIEALGDSIGATGCGRVDAGGFEEEDHTWPVRCGIIKYEGISTSNLDDKRSQLAIYWDNPLSKII